MQENVFMRLQEEVIEYIEGNYPEFYIECGSVKQNVVSVPDNEIVGFIRLHADGFQVTMELP